MANANPTAGFTTSQTGLKVSADGSTSSDPDGTIATYSWNWGDGSAADTGENPPDHTYATAGPYTITLTVTDNKVGRTRRPRTSR